MTPNLNRFYLRRAANLVSLEALRQELAVLSIGQMDTALIIHDNKRGFIVEFEVFKTLAAARRKQAPDESAFPFLKLKSYLIRVVASDSQGLHVLPDKNLLKRMRLSTSSDMTIEPV